VQRKVTAAAGTGFAGISGMRRCVIELSDSEEDGEEDDEEQSVPDVSKTILSELAPTTAINQTQQLELQIEILRRQIREREERRLKKLAAVSFIRYFKVLIFQPPNASIDVEPLEFGRYRCGS